VADIVDVGSALGLALNIAKCELIAYHDFVSKDRVLQKFKRLEIRDATLLGAPLFSGTVLDEAWSARCVDLAKAIDRLCLINAQDALILLRSSFSAPKVRHLLRCSPSISHPLLQSFDSLLRSAIRTAVHQTV